MPRTSSVTGHSQSQVVRAELGSAGFEAKVNVSTIELGIEMTLRGQTALV